MDIEKDKKLAELLKNHSRNFLQMAFCTDYNKRIENSDGYGQSTNECGDTVEIFLTVQGEKIVSVSIDIDGCINTNACSNAVALMAEGTKVGQAWGITPSKVIDYLETLPPHEIHCAELAVSALRKALVKFIELKRAPWKKLYT
jgi:nitrogen fixation NifU-like protein